MLLNHARPPTPSLPYHSFQIKKILIFICFNYILYFIQLFKISRLVQGQNNILYSAYFLEICLTLSGRPFSKSRKIGNLPFLNGRFTLPGQLITNLVFSECPCCLECIIYSRLCHILSQVNYTSFLWNDQARNENTSQYTCRQYCDVSIQWVCHVTTNAF